MTNDELTNWRIDELKKKNGMGEKAWWNDELTNWRTTYCLTLPYIFIWWRMTNQKQKWTWHNKCVYTLTNDELTNQHNSLCPYVFGRKMTNDEWRIDELTNFEKKRHGGKTLLTNWRIDELKKNRHGGNAWRDDELTNHLLPNPPAPILEDDEWRI